MTATVVVQAGIPALGTMLVIAAVALVLGLTALWLSRRHTRREAAELEGRRGTLGQQAERSGTDRPRDPGEMR